jgi:hypothetical protein
LDFGDESAGEDSAVVRDDSAEEEDSPDEVGVHDEEEQGISPLGVLSGKF